MDDATKARQRDQRLADATIAERVFGWAIYKNFWTEPGHEHSAAYITSDLTGYPPLTAPPDITGHAPNMEDPLGQRRYLPLQIVPRYTTDVAADFQILIAVREWSTEQRRAWGEALMRRILRSPSVPRQSYHPAQLPWYQPGDFSYAALAVSAPDRKAKAYLRARQEMLHLAIRDIEQERRVAADRGDIERVAETEALAAERRTALALVDAEIADLTGEVA